MADESRETGNDSAPVFLAWGMPIEAREGFFEGPALWLTGGASLLLWTVLYFLLTAA